MNLMKTTGNEKLLKNIAMGCDMKIIFYVLFFCFFCSFIKENEFPARKNKLISEFGKIMKKELQLSTFMTGSACQNDLETLMVGLESPCQADVETARMLFVYSAEKLLALVNQDKLIRPYLHDYPYTIKNLELDIRFVNGPMGGKLRYISNKGSMVYYTCLDEKENKLKDFYVETYNDAFKKARNAWESQSIQ